MSNKEPTPKDLLKLVQKEEASLFKRYEVVLKFTTPIDGGIPQTDDMIKNWIDARVSKGILGKDEAQRIKTEYAEEMGDAETAKEDAAKKRLTSFRVDEHGIFFESRCVKAMLKEGALTTGQQKKNRGSKQVWQAGTIITAIDAKDIHDPGRLRFTRGGKQLKEPEAMRQSVVHAMTPQGPRSSIKLNDCIKEGARLSFAVWTLQLGTEARCITDSYLAKVLAQAQQMGLGANRSQGQGRFKVVKFVGEKVEKVEAA